MRKKRNKAIFNWCLVITPLCVSVFLFVPHFYKFYPLILRNNLNIGWMIASLLSLLGCYIAIKSLTGKVFKILFFIANGITFLFYTFNWILGMPSGNF